MSNLNLRGILAAVVTPFTADGSEVDEDNLRQQVDRLIAAGIHGLVPTGSTGEFTSLTPEEHRRVIEVYVEAAAGRVPVIAGVGTLTTQGTVELAQFADIVLTIGRSRQTLAVKGRCRGSGLAQCCSGSDACSACADGRVWGGR